jgi:hypothetical protein
MCGRQLGSKGTHLGMNNDEVLMYRAPLSELQVVHSDMAFRQAVRSVDSLRVRTQG